MESVGWRDFVLVTFFSLVRERGVNSIMLSPLLYAFFWLIWEFSIAVWDSSGSNLTEHMRKKNSAIMHLNFVHKENATRFL